MKIKSKLFVFCFAFIVFSTLLTFLFLQFFAKTIVSQIEKKVLEDSLANVKAYMEREANELLSLTKDWAAWDDAWLYMQGKARRFVETNLGIESFKNNNLKLIAYFDLSGKLKAGADYDYEKDIIAPVNVKLWQNYVNYYISENFGKKGLAGITFVEEDPYFLSVFPVLKSDFSGSSKGYLVMARPVTKEWFDFLKKLLRLTEVKIEKETEVIEEAGGIDESVFIREEGGKYTLQAKEKDVFGNYSLRIYIEKEKFLWDPVKENVLALIVLYSLLNLVFLLFLVGWIDEKVIERMLSVIEDVRKIKAGKTEKLKIEGSDEIAYLKGEINKYLDVIEHSRRVFPIVAKEAKVLIVFFDQEGDVVFCNFETFDRAYLKDLYGLLKETLEVNNWEKTHLKEFKLREGLYVNGWVLPGGENNVHIIFIAYDITPLIEEKQRLEEKASKEAFTSLYNRDFFEDYFKKVVLNSQESGKWSLIFVDIDDMKKINDRFGHVVGDKVIQATAEAIRSSIRKTDIAARWGGDEFVILISGSLDVASQVAERIRNNLKDVVISEKDDQRVTFSLSVGVVEIEKDRDYETILKEADRLLYKAKTLKNHRR